ncbi:Poxvirus Late Transcription Factor VLTF3 like [uncultured virus]|nr:Poxvirus Late Transcription Factor VLTF3 like [uncultured virus]
MCSFSRVNFSSHDKIISKENTNEFLDDILVDLSLLDNKDIMGSINFFDPKHNIPEIKIDCKIQTDNYSYAYNRINHFHSWIDRINSKENIIIPVNVYEQINKCLYDSGKNILEVTHNDIKIILKKLNLRKYYENTIQIKNQLKKNQPVPLLNKDDEKKLCDMFKQIQKPFANNSHLSRNFLSYTYVLKKFTELLDINNLEEYLPNLKSKEKLRSQDKIWKNICGELNWKFIPSI